MKTDKYIPFLASVSAKLLHPFLKGYDNYLIKKHNYNCIYFPIYIIGAPRTGSTILYQTITNYFNVLYADNVVNHFYRTFFVAFRISNFFYKNEAHNSFKSFHGQTYGSGMHGPSECSGFWYRWLPLRKHYIQKGEISEESITEIRNNIDAVSNYFKKHIIFKNLNNGQRLPFIKEIHSSSRFIYITRDPFFTTQSILLARRKAGHPINKMFGVFPANYKELEQYDELEMVVRQVFELEKEIQNSLQLFPKENILKIEYQAFCNDPNKYLQVMERNLFKNQITIRTKNVPPEINLSETIKLSKEETDRIHRLITQLEQAN